MLVYVREAHPSDGRQTKSNERAKIVYETPKTMKERAAIATDCVKSLKLEMPCLLDNMDNAVQKTYRGFPARVCIVDLDGKIAFAGKPGPRGADAKTLEEQLRTHLGEPTSSRE